MAPPPYWIDLGPAPPLQQIWLRIALPQARFAELERKLYEMSDPKNARYGQHLLKEQVTEFVRPDRRSVQAVDAWLAAYGITGEDRVRRSAAGDWVTILVPVAVAESMLDTVRNKLLGYYWHVLLTVVYCFFLVRVTVCGVS
jgi:tripeptidyl-peptidase-1